MGQALGKKHDDHESKTSVYEHEYPGGPFPLIEVPEDILCEVLKRVPAKDVVKSCVYVCKQWSDIINNQSFWREKCVQDLGYTRDLLHVLKHEDFKMVYFKRPYQTNLIQNPDASERYHHWEIHEKGGDRWNVEKPIGCDPLEDFVGNIQSNDLKCWVTSFGLCSKSQTIDLLERGCSQHVLDEIKPKIHISEWHAARFDCGIRYKIKVHLLNKDKGTVKKWTFEDTKPAGREWFKVEHTFSDYAPGVRFIKYYHEGQDTQFWAGWYGAKMTLSSVILDLKQNEPTCTTNSSAEKSISNN